MCSAGKIFKNASKRRCFFPPSIQDLADIVGMTEFHAWTCFLDIVGSPDFQTLQVLAPSLDALSDLNLTPLLML